MEEELTIKFVAKTGGLKFEEYEETWFNPILDLKPLVITTFRAGDRVKVTYGDKNVISQIQLVEHKADFVTADKAFRRNKMEVLKGVEAETIVKVYNEFGKKIIATNIFPRFAEDGSTTGVFDCFIYYED